MQKHSSMSLCVNEFFMTPQMLHIKMKDTLISARTVSKSWALVYGSDDVEVSEVGHWVEPWEKVGHWFPFPQAEHLAAAHSRADCMLVSFLNVDRQESWEQS